MARPNWLISFIKIFYPRKPSYWGLTRVPIIGWFIWRFLFKGDKMIFLPADRTIEVNVDVGEHENLVLPSKLVDHFIDNSDYHLIMNFCICRESMQCEDYPIEYGCLFLGDAAKGINSNWGHKVTPDEAKAHIRKCQDAGLVHIIGRARLDTVWLGVGPSDKLMVVCNCCPCCCMFRGAPYLPEEVRKDLIKAPGVGISVSDLCTGCGSCTDDVCFVDAIEIVDGLAVIGEQCRGCGRCVDVCAAGAIEIEIDSKRFFDESVSFLQPYPGAK
jgi:NAD-dependent dihydropyrimidine dehydrogenase PreA subunit